MAEGKKTEPAGGTAGHVGYRVALAFGAEVLGFVSTPERLSGLVLWARGERPDERVYGVHRWNVGGDGTEIVFTMGHYFDVADEGHAPDRTTAYVAALRDFAGRTVAR